MNVFAVIALNDSAVLPVKNALASIFPDNYLEAGKMVWLIADPTTTVAVSNKLGIPQNVLLTSVLIVNFSSYYGRAPSSVWEWIKSKLEAVPK